MITGTEVVIVSCVVEASPPSFSQDCGLVVGEFEPVSQPQRLNCCEEFRSERARARSQTTEFEEFVKKARARFSLFGRVRSE